MDNEITLADITFFKKKLDERLMYVQALLDDGEIDKAKQILREITGS